jgi:hypothetical protein
MTAPIDEAAIRARIAERYAPDSQWRDSKDALALLSLLDEARRERDEAKMKHTAARELHESSQSAFEKAHAAKRLVERERDEARARLKTLTSSALLQTTDHAVTPELHAVARDRDALRAALEAISGMSNYEIMREVARTAIAAVQAKKE